MKNQKGQKQEMFMNINLNMKKQHQRVPREVEEREKVFQTTLIYQK